MMFPLHHKDKASSVPLLLLGDRRKPGGSAESIHRSPSHGEAYQVKKPQLYRVQGELVELIDLACNPLTISILKQLVHWSQRISGFELFVAEEKGASLQDRFSSFRFSSFYHGGLPKSAQGLLKKRCFGLLFLFSIIIEEFLCLKL